MVRPESQQKGIAGDFHTRKGGATHFLSDGFHRPDRSGEKSDEGVEVLDGVESAERGEDEDGVGDEGAFHDDFLFLYGHVGGSHGTISAQSRLFERGDGQRFFPADFQGEPLGLVLHG